jgi:hypothetical protein
LGAGVNKFNFFSESFFPTAPNITKNAGDTICEMGADARGFLKKRYLFANGCGINTWIDYWHPHMAQILGFEN